MLQKKKKNQFENNARISGNTTTYSGGIANTLVYFLKHSKWFPKALADFNIHQIHWQQKTSVHTGKATVCVSGGKKS